MMLLPLPTCQSAFAQIFSFTVCAELIALQPADNNNLHTNWSRMEQAVRKEFDPIY